MMKKVALSRKGMAISGILYTLLVLFLALIFGILGLVSNSKKIYDTLKGNLNNRLNGIEEPIIRTVSLKASANSVMVVVVPLTDNGLIENYYYSIDGTNYVKSKDASYTFSGLNDNETYRVYTKVEIKNGLQSKEATKSVLTRTLSNPKINQVSQVPASGYTYASKIVLGIDYTATNVTNPIYYFKSSVAATVASGVITGSCGTDTEPTECTASSVTTLVANTWYRTSNINPNIAYEDNGKLYAYMKDDIYVSGTSTYTISTIDKSNPTVTVKSINGKKITFNIKDDIGAIGYGVNQSSTTVPTFTSFTSSTDVDKTYNISSAGTYYIWVQDKAGNKGKTPFTVYNAQDVSYTNSANSSITTVKDALDYLYGVLK